MKRLLILTLGFVLLPPALAFDTSAGTFEDDTKPWQEVQAQLPPYPKHENLVNFIVSGATDNSYSIDTASIAIGDDEVVRYTVVIASSHGALTVNFEGMRCDPTEFKIYAFGHADNTWSKNRYAKWEGFQLRASRSYHKALFEDYLCPNGLPVRTAKEAISNFRRGQRRW
jgi:CNP1-like family